MKIKTRIYKSYFESILQNAPILPKYTHVSLSHKNECKIKKIPFEVKKIFQDLIATQNEMYFPEILVTLSKTSLSSLDFVRIS